MDIRAHAERLSKNRAFLMGIATLMVMVHHITWKSTNGLFSYVYMFIRHIGAGGVDVFLFLSGFGLYYSYKKSKDTFEFYRKRFLRIFPTWFLIAIPWYVYSDFFKSEEGILLFTGDITTLSFLTKGDRGHWYIFGIIVLYLIYPVWHKEIHKNTKKTIISFSVVWVASVICIACFNSTMFENINVFLMRVPIFFIGGLYGTLTESTKEISRYKSTILIFVVFMMSIVAEGLLCIKGMHYSALARVLYTPISLAICYFGPLFTFNKTLKYIITWLGGFSLEIYLIHMKTTAIITNFMGGNNLAITNIFSVLITLIVCCLIKKLSEIIVAAKIWRR